MIMNPPNKRTVAVLGGATALLLLGGVGGAVAAGQISGKQIKDHTITSKDLKKSSVRSIAIKNGNVKAQDLAAGVLAGITGPTGATGATARGRRQGCDRRQGRDRYRGRQG